MGTTQQAEPMRIRLTYDEQTGNVTREPAGEFKVGELLEFYSNQGRVKVHFLAKSAYQPDTYDETSPNKKPVRVVKAEPSKVWCYFEEKSGPGQKSSPRTSSAGVTWSERYGFDSHP
jgi:hypothetical protein